MLNFKFLLKNLLLSLILFTLTACTSNTFTINKKPAHQETIVMHEVVAGGKNRRLGYIQAEDTSLGLLIIPHLKNIPHGFHGFHVHMHPNCSNHGIAAGGHLDPYHTGKHLGPYENGHLGDLPVLYANVKGEITGPVIAPRLTLQQIRGHSLMIHVKGDNYSDHPVKLGGGGTRFACGIVKYRSYALTA